ncbi:GGDEF domain-containing protein [Acidisoma sp. 7E03]
MLNWALVLLRHLPVRHRLALVIGALALPAALTTLILVQAVDRANRTLRSSIATTIDDLMPVSRLDANLEQARFELQASATAGGLDRREELSRRIESDFDAMLAHHDLPPSLNEELRRAFDTWQHVLPVVDRALESKAPITMSDDAHATVDSELNQTISILENLRSQLLQTINSKYAAERRAEHLYNDMLIVLWTIGFVVIALAASLLAASIVMPLREISRTAALLRRGEYAVRLSVVGRDEFASVASTINTMAATIGAAHERLYDTALRDPLTGLLNRRGLDEALSHASASGEAFSILLVDLDHFKEINDRYGHSAGDEVLVGLAKCMVAASRGGDSIGRYGGDEFLILLPGAAAQAAEDLARRIYTALAQWNAGRSVVVQVSIGIAESGPGRRTVQEIIDAADQALYRAKTAGRATWQVAAS